MQLSQWEVVYVSVKEAKLLTEFAHNKCVNVSVLKVNFSSSQRPRYFYTAIFHAFEVDTRKESVSPAGLKQHCFKLISVSCTICTFSMALLYGSIQNSVISIKMLLPTIY